MNKFFVGLWLVFFPLLVMADSTGTSSLSLTPPASDYSVGFLGNLFGIVDGVLHGTGSQIMGAIFKVFNAAVLALGGIVIMYTLIVGTMNTAHEGEMLGHKWSSIWIPVRSTAGLALLIPKASGYCLMQIFVMWVVVQGVGAADKVWAAALEYLNSGGAIIQTTMHPTTSVQAGSNQIAQGASNILASEVCALGVQKQLEAARTLLLAQAGTSTPGPCGANNANNSNNTNSKIISDFCTTPVPNLLATLDAVAYQNATSTSSPPPASFTMPVPWFPTTNGTCSNPAYCFLNGICGSITWNALATPALPSTTPSSTATEFQAPASQVEQAQLIGLTRASALQQMIADYQILAQSMVSNDPQIGPPPSTPPTSLAWPQAINVFGVPYSASSGMPCVPATTDCLLWQGGYDQNNHSGIPIFNGLEFQNGIADYNGIMIPTLNLISQMASNPAAATKSRAFIAGAESQGWLSAGSYFFDMVSLSSAAVQSGNLTDSTSGLQTSTATLVNLKHAFSDSSNGPCATSATTPYWPLCTMLSAVPSLVTTQTPVQIAYQNAMYINALVGSTANVPPNGSALTALNASTAYGYVTNALTITIPGQPSLVGFSPNASLFPTMAPADTNFDMPNIPCSGFRISSMHTTICIGRYIATAFFGLFQALSYVFTQLVGTWVNNIIVMIISVPVATMERIFVTGVQTISQNPSANPIVQLAQMGVQYINAPADLYVSIITQVILVQFIPFFWGQIIGGLIVMMLALASPLIISWMGVMATIGFTTAFYVPFLPYMIFTFGVIAWLTLVIEAMVAAPIVALAITHPEGEGVLGNKGEHGLMILMNVFLRPTLMIIGFIMAIALCYVSVWIINTGFTHVATFIQGPGYGGWAGLYVLFFSVVIYTTMYVTVAQKAFDLIFQLPDNVLRWIGGTPEHAGKETSGWTAETGSVVKTGGEASEKGQKGVFEKGASTLQDLGGGSSGGGSDVNMRGGGPAAP